MKYEDMLRVEYLFDRYLKEWKEVYFRTHITAKEGDEIPISEFEKWYKMCYEIQDLYDDDNAGFLDLEGIIL